MGSRKLDELDLCRIPLIYLFHKTLTLLSVAIIIMPNPCTIVRALIYGCTWITGAIKNVFYGLPYLAFIRW